LPPTSPLSENSQGKWSPSQQGQAQICRRGAAPTSFREFLMKLRLTLENATGLPATATASVEFGARDSLSIGRAQGLDWTLPDPSRLMSGKHCEIRRSAQAYLLYDLSTNGTFVDGSTTRLTSPHTLRDGERLRVGAYLIRVELRNDGEPVSARRPGQQSFSAGHRTPAAIDDREHAQRRRPISFDENAGSPRRAQDRPGRQRRLDATRPERRHFPQPLHDPLRRWRFRSRGHLGQRHLRQ
jgi:type VI secretion system protein ImpI